MEQDANASLTAAPSGTLSSVCSSDLQTGSNQRPDQTAPHVVAPTSQPQGWHGLSSTSTHGLHSNRCLQQWMGSTHGRRHMVLFRETAAHKRAGVTSRPSGTDIFCHIPEEAGSGRQIRQLDSRIVINLYTRGYMITTTLPSNMGTPPVVCNKQSHPISSPSGWETEHHGRCPLQGESPSHGMDAPSFSGTVNLHDSRATSHRPLCLGTEQPTACILRSRTGPKGLGI